MGCQIDMEQTHIVTLNFDLTHYLDLRFSMSFFLNSCISGMGGPINVEWKGYESIGCCTYYVTVSYDFDLAFWRSNI